MTDEPKEKAPLIITIVVNSTGGVFTATNIKPEDFPLAYRALRFLEEQIFEGIAPPPPPPPANPPAKNAKKTTKQIDKKIV
jgi:hypothetical protein